MFCPKCGVQNIEDAKFCRGCGSDIALVPQALSGTLPEARDDKDHSRVGITFDPMSRRHRRRDGVPRLDKAVSNLFTGMGFVLVALAALRYAPAGNIWWFWMLIPAFSLIGGGIAEYMRYKQSKGEEVKLPGLDSKKELPPTSARVSAIPPRRNTAELVPQPPSVTENTTRHLDMSTEAPTRHIGRNDEL